MLCPFFTKHKNSTLGVGFCPTPGNTKTKVNYAVATFEALKETSRMRVTDEQTERLHIKSGPVGIRIEETDVGHMED